MAERTSKQIATIAGQLLNGKLIKQAEEWLQFIVDDPTAPEVARDNATVLLGTMAQVRRVAASALTQR